MVQYFVSPSVFRFEAEPEAGFAAPKPGERIKVYANLTTGLVHRDANRGDMWIGTLESLSGDHHVVVSTVGSELPAPLARAVLVFGSTA